MQGDRDQPDAAKPPQRPCSHHRPVTHCSLHPDYHPTSATAVFFPRARRHGLARCFLDFLKGTGDPWCLGVITWARRAPRIDATRESADVPWSVCYALTSTSPPNQSSGRKQSAIQWKQAFRKQHQLLLWLSIAWIAMIVDCF